MTTTYVESLFVPGWCVNCSRPNHEHDPYPECPATPRSPNE